MVRRTERRQILNDLMCFYRIFLNFLSQNGESLRHSLRFFVVLLFVVKPPELSTMGSRIFNLLRNRCWRFDRIFHSGRVDRFYLFIIIFWILSEAQKPFQPLTISPYGMRTMSRTVWTGIYFGCFQNISKCYRQK